MFPSPYDKIFLAEWGALSSDFLYFDGVVHRFEVSSHKTYIYIFRKDSSHSLPINDFQVQWGDNQYHPFFKKYVDDFMKILKMQAFL